MAPVLARQGHRGSTALVIGPRNSDPVEGWRSVILFAPLTLPVAGWRCRVQFRGGVAGSVRLHKTSAYRKKFFAVSFAFGAVERPAMAPVLARQGHRGSTALVIGPRNSDPVEGWRSEILFAALTLPPAGWRCRLNF